MGPVALVFFGMPAALAFIDESLKGILMLRTIHRASKRVDEVGEPTEAPRSVDEIDDDLLYPVSIDSLVPGSVIKKLHKCDVWKDMERGAEMAQQAKQVGEMPSCKDCGRMPMN